MIRIESEGATPKSMKRSARTDRIDTATLPKPTPPEAEDSVEEASLESFPASDSPAWIWGKLRFK